MKKAAFFVSLILISISACQQKETQKSSIIGSWKLFYNQIKEAGVVQIKDVSKNDFIKIINETHFSFINQPKDTLGDFYAGAGTYTFDGEKYTETLEFIAYKAIRNHQFHFRIEIKGDTLIQYGREKVEAANMDREIIEKYLRIK
ncbi:MAG: hypothetical protein JKY44_09785 [Flavobacteriaceae bacterium]|nr:hypothetical protein [Flavobacteriaceae bacterium]